MTERHGTPIRNRITVAERLLAQLAISTASATVSKDEEADVETRGKNHCIIDDDATTIDGSATTDGIATRDEEAAGAKDDHPQSCPSTMFNDQSEPSINNGGVKEVANSSNSPPNQFASWQPASANCSAVLHRGVISVTKRRFTEYVTESRAGANSLFLSRLECVGSYPFILQLNSSPAQNAHLPWGQRLLEVKLICEHPFDRNPLLQLDVAYKLVFTGRKSKHAKKLVKICECAFTAAKRWHSTFVLAEYLIDPNNEIIRATDMIETKVELEIRRVWEEGSSCTQQQLQSGPSNNNGEEREVETQQSIEPHGTSASKPSHLISSSHPSVNSSKFPEGGEEIKANLSIRKDNFRLFTNTTTPPGCEYSGPWEIVAGGIPFQIHLNSRPPQNAFIAREQRMIEVRLVCGHQFDQTPQMQLQIGYKLRCCSVVQGRGGREEGLARDAQVVFNASKTKHSNFVPAEQLLKKKNKAVVFNYDLIIRRQLMGAPSYWASQASQPTPNATAIQNQLMAIGRPSLPMRSSLLAVIPAITTTAADNSLEIHRHLELRKRSFTAYTLATSNSVLPLWIGCIGGYGFLVELDSNPLANASRPRQDRLLEIRLTCEHRFEASGPGLHLQVGFMITFTNEIPPRINRSRDLVCSCEVVFNVRTKRQSRFVLAEYLLNPDNGIIRNDTVDVRVDLTLRKQWFEMEMPVVT